MYLTDDFLLKNKTARKLYHTYAENTPIFDYHCHLSEKQILENNQFNDIYEVWLGGDHYKWRLMRNYGVDEEYITGNKSNKEKFIAYCDALGTAFGNPLYHWSQIELKEYFNCELEINAQNAEAIWNWCNEYIALNEISPVTLIEKSNVKAIFTTNEMFDDLQTFEKISQKNYAFKVIPAFRADKIMNVDAKNYKDNVLKLSSLEGEITNINQLEAAIENRLKKFIAVGTTASDISLERICEITTKTEAEAVFKKALNGEVITSDEGEIFKGYLTYFLMKLYAKYNVATEIHIGAKRNNNTVMLNKLGLDTGYDSVSDFNSIVNLSKLFDKLNSESSLPKCVLFNLNPKMNVEIMTLIGCFQDSTAKGKIQYGPAWWFLDNKAGMEKHLSDLTATGHLATFVGMLTDSRSFLSYPRHHYFRRILCNYLGNLIENGEMTADLELVGKVIKDVSFNNAVEYLNVKL